MGLMIFSIAPIIKISSDAVQKKMLPALNYQLYGGIELMVTLKWKKMRHRKMELPVTLK